MIQPRRRVVLHAGTPKTGSSALQVAFVRNRDRLDGLGVHYATSDTDERAARGEVTVGNSGELHRFLRGGGVRVRAAAHLAAGLAETALPTTLYSCEGMVFARGPRLSRLRDMAEAADTRLEAVILVRNSAPWLISYYEQFVKRLRFTGTFSEFLDAFEKRWRSLPDRLDAFAERLGSDAVRVLHYDSLRRDLLRGFLRLGLDVDPPEPALTIPGDVNRPLTPRELAWMRVANSLLGSDRQGRLLSDALVAGTPDQETRRGLSGADLERVLAVATPQVERINCTWFHGEPTMTTGVADLVPDPAPETPTAAERRLLEVCARLAGVADGRDPGPVLDLEG